MTGPALEQALGAVAALRIAVFRDWPYLYAGDLAYEKGYLEAYREPGAVLVGAFDGDRLVGAATGTPLAAHAGEFAEAFEGTGIAVGDVFYCAESVLLRDYRGQGVGHRFFDLREAAAREAGFAKSAFCSVIRPEHHPARPADFAPLDPFWRARGYAPLPGAVAEFAWTDIGQAEETVKPMQIWLRDLGPGL